MKLLFTLLLNLFLILGLHAQNDIPFSKKGKVLLETGYGILGGYSSGTGINAIVDSDGNTLTSLGATIGTFTSENFALKLNLSLLTGSGISITSLSAGGKYYFSGKIPVDLSLGYLSIDSFNTATSTLKVGYAIKLAPNIYLEPSTGIFLQIGNDAANLLFDFSFAMFL